MKKKEEWDNDQVGPREKVLEEEAQGIWKQRVGKAEEEERLRNGKEEIDRIQAENAKMETELKEAEENAKIQQLQAIESARIEDLRAQQEIENRSQEPDAESSEIKQRRRLQAAEGEMYAA